MQSSFTITNATVVLPDRTLPGGAVAVRQGRIAEVARSAQALATPTEEEIEAAGAYLLPGLVDLHNDGLELEINPRPGANISLDLAFTSFERRLIACGVTTELHAISFMDRARDHRTGSAAAGRSAYVAALQQDGRSLVDHQVLHRIDVWSPEHLDAVFESVGRLPVRYVSLNDHTPGQGQFRSLDQYLQRMGEYKRSRGHEAPTLDEVEGLTTARAADTTTVPAVYARVRQEAEKAPLVIASHDDDSPEKVEIGWQLGARIAEFPVTVEAAARARELGMAIVIGAPNIVRGGSQSGNLDACELVRRGLADVICADYHAPSLLAAAFRLVDEGLADLPSAIRAVTLNPARAVGLGDRGAIEPGLVADLLLVRWTAASVPRVEAAFRAGQRVLSVAQQTSVEAGSWRKAS